MDIIRKGSQPTVPGPAEYFTGKVRIDSMFARDGESRMAGAIVNPNSYGQGTNSWLTWAPAAPVQGAGSFAMACQDYGAFADAVRAKLLREIPAASPAV